MSSPSPALFPLFSSGQRSHTEQPSVQRALKPSEEPFGTAPAWRNRQKNRASGGPSTALPATTAPGTVPGTEAALGLGAGMQGGVGALDSYSGLMQAATPTLPQANGEDPSIDHINSHFRSNPSQFEFHSDGSCPDANFPMSLIDPSLLSPTFPSSFSLPSNVPDSEIPQILVPETSSSLPYDPSSDPLLYDIDADGEDDPEYTDWSRPPSSCPMSDTSAAWGDPSQDGGSSPFVPRGMMEDPGSDFVPGEGRDRWGGSQLSSPLCTPTRARRVTRRSRLGTVPIPMSSDTEQVLEGLNRIGAATEDEESEGLKRGRRKTRAAKGTIKGKERAGTKADNITNPRSFFAPRLTATSSTLAISPQPSIDSLDIAAGTNAHPSLDAIPDIPSRSSKHLDSADHNLSTSARSNRSNSLSTKHHSFFAPRRSLTTAASTSALGTPTTPGHHKKREAQEPPWPGTSEAGMGVGGGVHTRGPDFVSSEQRPSTSMSIAGFALKSRATRVEKEERKIREGEVPQESNGFLKQLAEKLGIPPPSAIGSTLASTSIPPPTLLPIRIELDCKGSSPLPTFTPHTTPFTDDDGATAEEKPCLEPGKVQPLLISAQSVLDQITPPELREHKAFERLKQAALARGTASAEATCRSDLWTDAHRPLLAAEVLGASNTEGATYLRDWLKKLELAPVTSAIVPYAGYMSDVERGAGIAEDTRGPDGERVARKRRKVETKVERSKKRMRRARARIESEGEGEWGGDETDGCADGFMVDATGKGREDMDLDSDVGGGDDPPFQYLPDQDLKNSPPQHSTSANPTSPVPPQAPSTYPPFSCHLTNTILLAGPPGTGKTSAVYAVAMELGWDVFEVYPGIGRRAGKDLMALVGGVGKNHLVGMRGLDGGRGTGGSTKEKRRGPLEGLFSAGAGGMFNSTKKENGLERNEVSNIFGPKHKRKKARSSGVKMEGLKASHNTDSTGVAGDTDGEGHAGDETIPGAGKGKSGKGKRKGGRAEKARAKAAEGSGDLRSMMFGLGKKSKEKDKGDQDKGMGTERGERTEDCSMPEAISKEATPAVREVEQEVMCIDPGLLAPDVDPLAKDGEGPVTKIESQKTEAESSRPKDEDFIVIDDEDTSPPDLPSIIDATPNPEPSDQTRLQSQNPSSGGGVRQSLILLEEVDILFEEDKNFWNAVVQLIKESKRPVVMTCNDSNLLPLATLPLQAVLQFQPLCPSIAIPYLQVLAFSEGHILHHDALYSLYANQKYHAHTAEALYSGPRGPEPSQEEGKGDMRRAIMQLQGWCQRLGPARNEGASSTLNGVASWSGGTFRGDEALGLGNGFGLVSPHLSLLSIRSFAPQISGAASLFASLSAISESGVDGSDILDTWLEPVVNTDVLNPTRDLGVCGSQCVQEQCADIRRLAEFYEGLSWMDGLVDRKGQRWMQTIESTLAPGSIASHVHELGYDHLELSSGTGPLAMHEPGPFPGEARDNEMAVELGSLARLVLEENGTGERIRGLVRGGEGEARCREEGWSGLGGKQTTYQTSLINFCAPLLPLSAGLLPSPRITLDYGPYIRSIVASDDAHLLADEESARAAIASYNALAGDLSVGNGQGMSGELQAGTKRATRNSIMRSSGRVAYERHLWKLGEEELAFVKQTEFTR